MADLDNTLIYETLKKVHQGQADLRNAMTDMRSDIRDLKASNTMILNLIGDLVKATARDDDRFARIEARLEVLEHRHDQEHPPT